jgi:hypothetical protein
MHLAAPDRLQVRLLDPASEDHLEITVVPAQTSGPAFHRFERVAVRYRGKASAPTPARRETLQALILGVGAAVERRWQQQPSATMAEALGRFETPRRVLFSREGLRSLLSPDIEEQAPLSNDWTLADIYPTSHTDKTDRDTLELVLDFRRALALQRLQIIVARREDGRQAFARTEHFALSYRTPAGGDPPGARTLRALVTFLLESRDGPWLEVIFPTVAADLTDALLPAPEPSIPDAPSSHALNLALDADCNQSCSFCSVKDLAPASDGGPARLARALEDLAEGRRRGVRTVRINGYDPLAFSGILTLLKTLVPLGYTRVELFSPCARLADKSFCQEVVSALPTERCFFVPLYATEAAAHDHTVGRQGAFAQVMEGLENLITLVDRSCISVLSVATTDTLQHLAPLARWSQEKGLSFSAHMPYPSHEGRDDRYYTRCPRQTETARALAALYPRGDAFRPFPVHGVAPCVTFRSLSALGVPPRRWLEVPDKLPPLPGTEYREARFSHGAGERTDHAFAAATVPCPQAPRCALLPACGGELLRAYLEAHGAEEFRAVSLTELVRG